MRQNKISRQIDLVAFQKGLEVQGYTEEQIEEIGTALSGSICDCGDKLKLVPIKICKIKNVYCIHVHPDNNSYINYKVCNGEYCE